MKVLFFAQLKEVTGLGELEFHCEKPIKVEEFWQRLITDHPELEHYRHHIRLARNCAYARADECFMNSDEIALIPPVSGG